MVIASSLVRIPALGGQLGSVYPTTQARYLGETATIHCYSEQPVKWIRDREPVIAGVQPNNSLVFKPLVDDDAGIYRCFGTAVGSPFEVSSELLVGGMKQ